MTRFIVVESFLLGCLFLIAAYVFRQSFPTIPGVAMLLEAAPGLQGSSPLGVSPFVAVIAGICILPIILYWVLQWMGKTERSFWMVTLLSLGLQFPAVLAHNQLDWALFWRAVKASPEMSQITIGSLFLVSLALLLALQRAAELRRLNGRLANLRLERGEQGQIIVSEVVVLAGLIGSTLVVTSALMLAAAGFARMGNLLGQSHWTVLAVGAAALFIIVAFLHFWLRMRRRTDATSVDDGVRRNH